MNPRVVAETQTAARKYGERRRQIPKWDKPSEVESLDARLGRCSDDLKRLVDGNIEAPMMIWSWHGLGVDIRKIVRLIYGKKEITNDVSNTEVQPSDAIDVEFEVKPTESSS